MSTRERLDTIGRCRDYVTCALLACGCGSELDIHDPATPVREVSQSLAILNDTGLCLSVDFTKSLPTLEEHLGIVDRWLLNSMNIVSQKERLDAFRISREITYRLASRPL